MTWIIVITLLLFYVLGLFVFHATGPVHVLPFVALVLPLVDWLLVRQSRRSIRERSQFCAPLNCDGARTSLSASVRSTLTRELLVVKLLFALRAQADRMSAFRVDLLFERLAARATVASSSGVQRHAGMATHVHGPRKQMHNGIATAEDRDSYANIQERFFQDCPSPGSARRGISPASPSG